eukprot:CAMPEP_0183721758 /NCGR_PEP_ID=MMETSP0737-20130205/13925_1 /TAXON_ID=385413 /ORGANISM="Thalassiosira miniscula, Strain CCMP1093" /LENGTH=912 /DNA_ID=CAMNT_0025951809 /DNA_START=117 /DNA_END=2855 /DNA_ORIENTATION=+
MSVSISTRHFADHPNKKDKRIKPLPIDFFSRQYKNNSDAKLQSDREMADKYSYTGIKYFTSKAEEEPLLREAERKKLSEKYMPFATRHFAKLDAAEEEEAARRRTMKARQRKETIPTAIRHFTLKEMAEEEQRQRRLDYLKAHPPPMPNGVAHFTNEHRDDEEQGKKVIETRASARDSPPPASAATKHFKKSNESGNPRVVRKNEPLAPAKAQNPKLNVVRKIEPSAETRNPKVSDVRKNEPSAETQNPKHNVVRKNEQVAHPAMQHFNQTSQHNETRKKELAKIAAIMNQLHPTASVATVYFAKLKVKKAIEVQALREAAMERVRSKEPMQSLPTNYFNRQYIKETEYFRKEDKNKSQAKPALEFVDKYAPFGIKYFTAKAENDRILRESQRKQLREEQMSDAAWHFANLAELSVMARTGDVTETIPVAIQHFTLEDRARKEGRRLALQYLKANPPPLSNGVAHFNRQLADQREKAAQQRGKLVASIQAPLDGNSATDSTTSAEYFKEIEEAKKFELEIMLKALVEEQSRTPSAAEQAEIIQSPHENQQPIASASTSYFKEIEDAKNLELEMLLNEFASPSIENFPQKTNEEKIRTGNQTRALASVGKKAANTKAQQDSPPPAAEIQAHHDSTAAAYEHFERLEESQKVQLQMLMNEPALPAIEHFNQNNANGENKGEELAKTLRSEDQLHPSASVATIYFAKLEDTKAIETEAARVAAREAALERIRTKAPVQPLPTNYFNTQYIKESEFFKNKDQAALEDKKTRPALVYINKDAPISIKYFTIKAEKARLYREAERKRLAERRMSDAAWHFAKLAELSVIASTGEIEETMPVAIQHFTLDDRIAKEERRQALEYLKTHPPPMPAGIAHFNKHLVTGRERQVVEIESRDDWLQAGCERRGDEIETRDGCF